MEGHEEDGGSTFPSCCWDFTGSTFLPAALYRAYGSWRKFRTAGDRSHDSLESREPLGSGDGLEWFAGLWVVGVFIFFSLSHPLLTTLYRPSFRLCRPGRFVWAQGLKDPSTKGLRVVHFAMELAIF